MFYGDVEEALRKVQSGALQELADMIESGEEVPEALRHWFAEESLEKRPQDRKNGKECAVRTTIACTAVPLR